MPQISTDLGSRLVWPVKIQPPNRVKPLATTASLAPDPVTPAVILKATYTNASTIDTDGISASHAGAGTAGTTSMTIGGALATGGVATLTPPRNVVITVTHGSSVVAMNGVITGTDQYGKVITETWSVTAGTTSKTYTGAVAFKTVTGITEIVVADASANSIIVGDGKKLGLPFKAAVHTIIAETEDGAACTAGAIVKASSSANADARGTYAPNSTLNGALDFVVYFLSEDPVTL